MMKTGYRKSFHIQIIPYYVNNVKSILDIFFNLYQFFQSLQQKNFNIAKKEIFHLANLKKIL